MQTSKVIFAGFVSLLMILSCTSVDFDYTSEEESSIAPIITILGPNPFVINTGDTYTDPGAQAVDSSDGDISDKISVDKSEVNIFSEGNYYVYYSVTDNDNNTTTAERTVTVREATGDDTEKPQIQLVGDNPFFLFVGDVYTDPGATATDNVDGNITFKIEKYDTVISTIALDTHWVYYVVSDEAGNTTVTTRTVIVCSSGKDTLPPVITLKGPNPINLTVGNAYNEYGATAEDNVDGDISDDITIDDSQIDVNNEGSYKVIYTVSDAAGNEGKKERTVNVYKDIPIDSMPPVITLQGDNPMGMYVDSAYVEPGATALDNIDGNITKNIVIDTSAVNTTDIGSFVVIYSVSDAAGNKTTEERTVNVVPFIDTIPPVITIIGPNPINLGVGYDYIEQGATALDETDGDLTSQITITGDIDVYVPATYTRTYEVSDKAGNTAKEIRTVNIVGEVDTIPPVITLKGNNPFSVELNSTYNEPGATAQDNLDGNVSSDIKITGTVNTSQEGDYIRTYTVTDKSGNTGTKTRTVKVVKDVDDVKPVITLKGSNPMKIQVNTQYVEPGATAQDNVDGDITSKIQITGSVDVSKIGTYTRTYTVSDKAGNTATKTRTVNVVTNIIPEWKVGTSYDVGDKVTYNGKTYVCRQSHTAVTGWDPASAAALWQLQKR